MFDKPQVDTTKYYTSGEFAKKAHITKKTIRYYHEHNILVPSYVNDNGNRYYTDDDFARLQQVLFLKYLGFSLEDIKQMTMQSGEESNLSASLKMQLGLIEERIEQMELVKLSIQDAMQAVSNEEEVSWSEMLELVNTNTLEQKIKTQYMNSSNISARIMLHKQYAHNTQGWFEWVFEQCDIKKGESVLELGCGSGALWSRNFDRLPKATYMITDISDGMIKDVRKNLGAEYNDKRAGQCMGDEKCMDKRTERCTGKGIDKCFDYQVMDAHHINAPDETYDVVIANHLLFYLEDLGKALKEIKRVLKPGGRLICSTYGSAHMKEINELVSEFDNRIVLSADKLYEVFGKENGAKLLKKRFAEVEWRQYEDYLTVDSEDALVAYILSCHGNQNMYIVDKYKDFRAFVKKKTDKGFHITKDAGVFVARK